jgi:hypothetical protein
LDTASGGRRLSLRHRRHRIRCLSLRSRPFAWSGRRRIDEAFSVVSFGRAHLGAPLDRRLFSVEDANSRRPFSDLVEPSPNRVVPLTFPWSLSGTPDRHSLPTDALSATRSSRMASLTIDLRAEGPCFVRPVKALRAKARKRLRLYQEPASRNPHVEPARTFVRKRFSAHRFAFSPL